MSALAKAAERWGSAGVANGGGDPKAAPWQEVAQELTSDLVIAWTWTSVPQGVVFNAEPTNQGA